MENTLSAIELTGVVDKNHQLKLDADLPITGPKRVRVIVLYSLDDEWDETEWLRSAARSPAFLYLKEETEDIYSQTDGRPFHDKV